MFVRLFFIVDKLCNNCFWEFFELLKFWFILLRSLFIFVECLVSLFFIRFGIDLFCFMVYLFKFSNLIDRLLIFVFMKFKILGVFFLYFLNVLLKFFLYWIWLYDKFWLILLNLWLLVLKLFCKVIFLVLVFVRWEMVFVCVI